ADIVLIDFDKPHLTPRHNVVSHLVYAAKAADVETVLVNGKVLLRGGQFTALDAGHICTQASTRAQKLAVIDRG
ncbi:MAG: 5-methylthioadenosine/S-adenosylhomocysteine deaminase, partial [Abditibacteriota bacterium]|nr:5-methylthioadenosine/S-adenosylhomocysteine deaminase [Abditibacteriota bacterium]